MKPTEHSGGRSVEERQQRLAERLRDAREYLGLSQQFVQPRGHRLEAVPGLRFSFGAAEV